MSRFSATSYAIGKPTRRCAATGRGLEVGERYVAALCEQDGQEHLQRVDFSAQAWDQGARPGEGLRVVGSWRAIVSEPGAARKPILDDEAMLDLLSQLEPGDPQRDAMRFVLALMLIRRKVLVQDGLKAGAMMLRPRGQERDPSGAGLIEIHDPKLDETALLDTIARLEALAGDGPGEQAGDAPAPGEQSGAAALESPR
jgi:hypothetical protein